MTSYARLTAGDQAPWFFQRTPANPRYAFDTTAGRYIVLCFFASANDAHSQAALRAVAERPGFFDDKTACFFGVSLDPHDEVEKRVANRIPGYRFFWDFDATVSRLYGAAPAQKEATGSNIAVRRLWVVLDPTLRLMKVLPFAADRSDVAELLAFIDGLPPPDRFAGVEMQAPILLLPNAFEPEFCRKLIGLYEQHGGEESGFMKEVDGKTVGAYDFSRKRRKDFTIADIEVIKQTQTRVMRHVVPMIRMAHQFNATRMERYIVACYAAEDQAHFCAHRDNTTKGTAHRRFAVSINLNEDFDGGEVSFPEFGPRSYKAPTGAAVVFSCSLLHEVSKVTRGRRYVFLPFLYDDEAARQREANTRYVEESKAAYKSGLE